MRKIQTTKNYRIFARSADNRPVDKKKHKRLMESMKLYGFLACFPLACVRDASGRLIVKDGQHRLQFAETLGLPVHYVEEQVDFDIATVNSAVNRWTLADYAHKYAQQGNEEYQEGLDFAEANKLPIGVAFSLLAGTASFGNIQAQFNSGQFKIKDRSWANMVAGVYGPIVAMSDQVRNTRFMEACMAVCRVSDFDPKRLLLGAERCRDKLVSYGTKDAYLDLAETLYNFGRKQLFSLKNAAIMAMRDRQACKAKSQED